MFYYITRTVLATQGLKRISARCGTRAVHGFASLPRPLLTERPPPFSEMTYCPPERRLLLLHTAMNMKRNNLTMTTTPPETQGSVCYSCQALRGERHISPGQPIYQGQYWQVDHAWPTALIGWVVLVLRRHAAALHELTADEFAEMGTLLARTVQALHTETGCAKEYLACFAEADHFNHVHIHIVPRAANLPQTFQGPRIFALLNPDDAQTAKEADVRAFCARLAHAMS